MFCCKAAALYDWTAMRILNRKIYFVINIPHIYNQKRTFILYANAQLSNGFFFVETIRLSIRTTQTLGSFSGFTDNKNVCLCGSNLLLIIYWKRNMSTSNYKWHKMKKERIKVVVSKYTAGCAEWKLFYSTYNRAR